MLSTRKVIGRAVTLRGGEVLGFVGDAVIDPSREEVLAWLIRPACAGPEDTVLPLEAVFEVRPHRLTVTSGDDLVAVGRLPRVEFAWRHGPRLGHTLLTSGDLVLGTLHDAYFDAESYQIVRYDVLPGGEDPHPIRVPADQTRWTGNGVWEASATARHLF